MQVLSPAGSYAALQAAVYGGADAVYLGAAAFNARIGAQGFDDGQIRDGIRFCHERGVKVYAALNTLISDREMDSALRVAEMFVQAGADAFIVQDLGLAAELRRRTDVPLHASTQATVNTLEGVRAMQELGFKRVVLARELSRENIAYITARADVQTEIFVHGSQCVSYSGQCYMSSVIGCRSGNRGRCAQPCRLPYRDGYALSLKDMCLLRYVRSIADMGVACVKIEGRMKSPGYVYAVTRAYADAVRGAPCGQAEEEKLARIFSRGGFSDAYFRAAPGPDMFGTKTGGSQEPQVVKKEYKRIGISFAVHADGEGAATVTGVTDDGFEADEQVPCHRPVSAATDERTAAAALFRLGDTVYYPRTLTLEVPQDGVFIPVSALNAARRAVTGRIRDMRLLSAHTFRPSPYEPPEPEPAADRPRVEGWFLSPASVPPNAGLLDRIWLPLMSLPHDISDTDRLGVSLPPIADDDELPALRRAMHRARRLGISRALCGNIGQIRLARDMGFEVHGDYGLNIFNSRAREEYAALGLSTYTVSFEQNLAAAQRMCGRDGVLVAYGRLPFMYTRNCIKKKKHGRAEYLTDRLGKDFLVTCEFGCRNRIWNSDRLYMADRRIDKAGALRLLFTDEDARTAARVIDAYVRGSDFEPPWPATRGLYFKKV